MKIYRRLFVLILLALSFILAFSSFASRASMQGASGANAAREDAYRANNLGVALLEQFKYKEAAVAFRRALKIDPQLAMARINLAIALYNIPDLVGAQREAEAAAKLAPKAPQPHYILGRLAKDQNRLDDAVAALQRVIVIDPRDTGANILLGQVYAQQRKYPEAITLFRTAYDAEPYNGTALYSLGTAMLRGGDREEGQRLIQRFKELRESGAATSIGNNYLEQGRYAEAITSTGAEPELVDKKTPDVTFVDATASTLPGGAADVAARSEAASGGALGRTFKGADFNDGARNDLLASLAGGATLFDYDSDGDLDLIEVNAKNQKLYRNDGGKMVDVTAQSGALAKESTGAGIGAVAGDFDNDEKPDLFVLRHGANALYRNEGNGSFADVTAAAKLPAYPHLSISAAFVDADHDGDLDILIAGLADLTKPPRAGANGATFPQDFAGAPNMLLRNNGNGTFVDYTAQAKVAGPENNHVVAVVPTDYDNRRDVDLLMVSFGTQPVLYRNLRDGTFRDVAAEVGLDAKNRDWKSTAAAAGDTNKDGFTDFYFTDAGGAGFFAVSDGQGRFRIEPNDAPANTATRAAQFLDYDNDGLLDLVVAGEGGVSAWRNVGSGWQKAGDAPLWKANLARAVASADVDGDGDVDLIARSASGHTLVGRNEGGNRNRSVRVRLTGKVSNRSGVASKIEARAGSLQQKLETYSATPAPAPADVVFGLGQRQTTDAVRVIWPAGIVQAETEITPPATAARAADTKPPTAPVAPTLNVIELDRKPSSCPYLFAWNGERFEFITDFMGGGELGYWVAPGVRAAPDPDEYVRIRGDQLKPRDGRFEIRVTNELEEALFMDRLQLLAVAHPEGVEVYPNEGLGNPTSSAFKLYATRSARPPIAATDDKGQDVLDRIQNVDRKYPDDFRLHRIRGYADEHALTLDLGNDDGGRSKEGKGVRHSEGRAFIPHPSSLIPQQRTLLLLTGWTDYAFSSDNVAAAQSGLSLAPPALQVKDGAGKWQTVIPNIGIPVGRPQTVTVDLTGKFLSQSREVRIVTNMRIYWDQILADTSGGKFETRIQKLEPQTANLRWRGFSAEATPDGREPFGYTYERVSATSPWKTFPGRYTREGDVRELLTGVDDMFVVSRPGDEISIAFDATKLPPLPRGWKRTFLLFTEGYSKEMDINSASPDQVAPLPFKGMKNYPYSSPESYPMTDARRAYIERYNTRVVADPVQTLIGRQRHNTDVSERLRSVRPEVRQAPSPPWIQDSGGTKP